jgi:hypothetical protein
MPEPSPEQQRLMRVHKGRSLKRPCGNVIPGQKVGILEHGVAVSTQSAAEPSRRRKVPTCEHEALIGKNPELSEPPAALNLEKVMQRFANSVWVVGQFETHGTRSAVPTDAGMAVVFPLTFLLGFLLIAMRRT